jgi:hypothetical protein
MVGSAAFVILLLLGSACVVSGNRIALKDEEDTGDIGFDGMMNESDLMDAEEASEDFSNTTMNSIFQQKKPNSNAGSKTSWKICDYAKRGLIGTLVTSSITPCSASALKPYASQSCLESPMCPKKE